MAETFTSATRASAGRTLAFAIAPSAESMLAVVSPFVVALVASLAFANGAAAAGFTITCDDAQGKHHARDRPNPECLDRPQRVLNSDGSLHHILLPEVDPAVIDACKKKEAAESATKQDALRLIKRYPNEAVHQKARKTKVDGIRAGMVPLHKRIDDLKRKRKPLDDEAEFYVGKPLPPDLKRNIDANESQAEAARSLLRKATQEIDDTNVQYDKELVTLKALWTGPPPRSWPVSDCTPATLVRQQQGQR